MTVTRKSIKSTYIWYLKYFLNPGLRNLFLGGNQLMEIPSEIKAFKHLKVLYLGGNLLTELPSTICQLKKVRALILCQNRLRSLPNCICKLQSLECLQLHQVFWLEFREMYSFNKYFRLSFFPTRMNWQPFHMAWSLSTVWKNCLWGIIHWW